jgi:NAD(P)H-dependent FMN reductase
MPPAMDLPKLAVIIVSTRPGRVGPTVAQWFFDVATAYGQFDVELVDLKDINLPVFDEPKHPRFADYAHEHTKVWSAIVKRNDAFVFVTPEYDYFAPPSLVNAIVYLFQEWARKPAAFVSYGGISGGMRSAQAIKPLLTSVKVMPLPEAVSIQLVNTHIENGAFKPTEGFANSAKVLLDELHRWAVACKPMRA